MIKVLLIKIFSAIRLACAIPDHDTGWVSVYTEAGWRRDLAPLRGERWRHACISYTDRGARVMT